MNTQKIGRNDPCPCGSGKKYKQCCGQVGSASTHASQAAHAPTPPSIQTALQYHQAGNLQQAEAIYRQILQATPRNVDALYLLGVIALQAGNNQAAVELISKAVEIQPSLQMYYNLGFAHQALGNADAAVENYRRALALKPDYVEAHSNLGNVLHTQGKLDAAIQHYHAVLAINPGSAEAHLNLGNVLMDQGALDAAAEAHRKALAIKPDYADAYNNLGNVLQAQGKLDAAIENYRKALVLKPDYAQAHYNLGVTLQAQRDFAAAGESYRSALSYQPAHAQAHNNLGLVLYAQDRLAAALESYRVAIALKPDYLEPHNNLGIALQTLGNLDEAIACYRQALVIDPAFIDAHNNLIFTLDLMASVDTSTLQAERKKWDAVHAAPLAATHRAHTNQADPERRLRIGYVSADFREHSAASVFGAMLVHFDRARYEVYAYSNSQIEDAHTRLFQQNVTHWNKIAGLSDQAVADLIRQDKIDILVDLSGHSAGNRLLVFARKPAPLQITAWGYATSTGMQAMDVFFADPVIVPPEEKSLFTEDVRYLPNVVGYFSTQAYPAVNTLPALSAAHVTFGSFNRLSKISEQAFQVWAQVLAAIPNSRLILKTPELGDPATREQVAAHFTQAGIDPARITLLGRTSWEQHMSAFHQVDIALDPFPHGGGVTTLESLMMGVPVITLRWQTIVGRLSASILTTLGLNDWIAETPEQYIEIAVQKALDVGALNALRLGLRDRLSTSIIGDNAAYAAAVEQEYRQLWMDWCGGRHAQNRSGFADTPSPRQLFSTSSAIQESIQAALQHYAAGRLPEVEALCRQVVQVEPNQPDALHLLGLVAHHLNQNDLAAELIGKAVSVYPTGPMHYNLGSVLQAQGKLDAAADSYRAALALSPDNAEAHGNLGSIFQTQGKLGEAVKCYQQALILKPGQADLYNNLGNVFKEQGKPSEAIASFRRALALKPDFAAAYYDLGNVFNENEQLDDALECFRQAFNIKPDFAQAHCNFGNVLQAQGKHDLAIESYRNALLAAPNYAQAHYNLGVALQRQGHLDDSITCYHSALAHDPGFVDAHSNLIFTLDLAAGVDTAALQAERKKWDALHGAPLAAAHCAHANPVDPERRLRIGYVSADFREHSAATVFGGMLVHFDRSRFEVYAYSNSRIEDAHTRLFQQNVNHWRKIAGLSDQAVADLIRQDQIDILVDLSGHSAGNRLLVFARKPAPLQVTAWGYATSTGLQAIDVFFADQVVVPPAEKSMFVEEIRYLPNVMSYFSQQAYPEVNALPALAAPQITFGSFNRLVKTSEQAFQVWRQILTAIPNSRLMLKASELNDAETRAKIAARFAQAGIDPARIAMHGGSSWKEHMAALNQVDIALDPFPHGGGVTTIECLMMGVPVITLRWPTIVGRLSASILGLLGMHDWIADTPEQYVEIAVRKAQDLVAVNSLRRNLREMLKTSIIGDTAAYAVAVEAEYRQLWHAWCARQGSTQESIR